MNEQNSPYVAPENGEEQAMACLSCGLAGWVSAEHFPQEPGLWDRPCPSCGAMTVWVTEPRLREDTSQ